MEPVTTAILGMALYTGLAWAGEKFAEATLDPVLEQYKERLKGPFKKAEKGKSLQEAFRRALQQAGAPVEDEDKLAGYLKRTGLVRLQSEANQALRHQVALAVVGFVDAQAEPPEALLLALGWPRSQKKELAALLAALRAELAGLEQWKDLIAYADSLEQRQQLGQLLAQWQEMADVLVMTEAGKALRVALVEVGLEEGQAAVIDRVYRQGLQAEYRMHVVTGLAQVQRAVRLPLQEIYLELGLIPLSVEKEQDGDLQRELAAPEAGRLRMEMQRVERRVSNALADAPRLVIVGKPGSGKTTSLRFIALMLAMGQPGASRLGLDAPYLPVLVRLSDYARKLSNGADLALETFLMEYIQTEFPGAARQGEYLQLVLQKGGCLVLLDGLDEVGDVGGSLAQGRTLRSEVLRQVRRFAERRCSPGCNRLVVTSRLEGYHHGDLPGFSEMELSPLRAPDEVEDFLLRWFTAYIHDHDPGLALGTAQAQAQRQHVGPLMHAIMNWESVRRLALNPLLLTILALIHEMGKRLPNRRVELYDIVAKTMVENWRQAQTGQASHLYEELTSSQVFYLLAALAYWLHENRPGGTMPQPDWERKITGLLAEQGVVDSSNLVERFLRHARQETGLLAERSPGQIGFFHLTLEEYLAAVEMARQETDQRLAMLEAHWQDPYWEEVLLLAAGALQARGADLPLKAFLAALVGLEAVGEQAGRPALLAGRALADLGRPNLRNPLHQNILRVLKETMQDLEPASQRPSQPGRVTLARRAAAGEVLDELGWLPEDLHHFVRVEGAGKSAKAFYLARYPVTNAQYARFLASDDFADPALWRGFPKFDEKSQPMPGDWGETGWKWLQADWDEQQRILPRYWNDPTLGAARQGAPVVEVTWYEANAYCRWLQRHWAGLPEAQANPGLQPGLVRLPTEAEWARAAGSERPEKRYPWDAPGQATGGLDEILRRANIRESRIGRTTPVGMYPLGVSQPFGLWDLAGNVWEWQANFYRKEHDYLGLRGGSWDGIEDLARVASRDLDRSEPLWLNRGFRAGLFPS